MKILRPRGGRSALPPRRVQPAHAGPFGVTAISTMVRVTARTQLSTQGRPQWHC